MNRKVLTVLTISIAVLGVVLLLIFISEEYKDDKKNIREEAVIQEGTAIVSDIIDTSGWNMYRNEKYGYEIKYPSGWEVGAAGNSPVEDFPAPYFSPKSSEKIHPNLMVGNIHRLEPGETIETDLPLGAGSEARIIKKEKTVVGGKDAILVEYFQSGYGNPEGGLGKVRQQIKVVSGGYSYLIHLDEKNDDNELSESSRSWKYKDILEAMVESIRFLGTTSFDSDDEETDVSPESIYENSKYGFTLNLPESWNGYKASEFDDGKTICFSVPKEGSQPFCIFQLYIISDDKPIPNGTKLIGEASGQKVAVDKDISCIQFDDFQCEISKQVPEIIKTFKAE